MEYERCMTEMKRNLKQTLEIANTTPDPETKLQARAIANDCYKYIMDLTTNGVVITDALNYENGKTKKLSSVADKKLSQEGESEESKESEEPDYGEEELKEGQEKGTGELEDKEEKTTNDVF